MYNKLINHKKKKIRREIYEINKIYFKKIVYIYLFFLYYSLKL